MFKRSLPLRILIVNFAFLILPILLYFFFIFRLESDRELKRTVSEIENIGLSRSILLNQISQSHFTELSTIQNLLNFENLNVTDSSSEINKKLLEFAKISGVNQINFFIITASDEYIVYASSDFSKIGKNDTFRVYINEAITNGKSLYLGYHVFSYKKFLFLSQAVYSTQTGEPIGVLSMVISIEDILKKLMPGQYLPFDVRISILTSDSIVFASTDESFEMNSLYPISESRLIEIQNSDQFGPYLIKLGLPDFKKDENYKNLYQWKEGKEVRMGLVTPIEGADIAIFVDCSKSQISANFYRHLKGLAIFIGTLTLITSLLNLWFNYRIGKPLNHLFNVMQHFSNGLYEEKYKKDSFGFEINQVGENLNQMVLDLKRHIEDIKNEKAARELIAKELKIGRDIQMSILPQQMPSFKGIDIQARSLPALEVGGDFYDVYIVENPKQKNHKRLVATIADGAGKGASACLYSLCLRSILRSYATEFLSVGEVMQLSNNLFWKDTEKSSFFATAVTLNIDLDDKKFSYYSAGHTPCIIRRKDGSLFKLPSQGLPMGIDLIDKPDQNIFEIMPSDLIVLYTDGVTDCQNTKKELFGEKRFDEFLKVYGQLPLPMLINDLYRELENFSKGNPQYDDITVILIRIL
jgi:sigma-B regulation protein RsbU (phosphoserine phosphatase)